MSVFDDIAKTHSADDAALRASIRSAVEQEIAEYIYRYAAYQVADITRPWFPGALAELADAISSGSYRKAG